jgi:ABC-2 type transport system permease protein
VSSFLGRNVFFVVILFIFFSLWRVIFADQGVVASFTMTQTLWYLTFTETIEMCRVRLHGEVQAEVRDGSIAYGLTRPFSYVTAKLWRAMGESTVKVASFLVVGFAAARVLAGPLPGYTRALPFGLLLIAGGLLLNSLWYLLFGLLAFWLEEVSPITWVFQKLVFVLGGMFFPIDFFPVWLQGVARELPFAYTAYWPALSMVKWSWETFLHAAAGQAAYIAILTLAVALLYRVAIRRVHANGG